jgi:hypothetical protein
MTYDAPAGAAAGVATGAVAGALIGGPVGAAVGATVGAAVVEPQPQSIRRRVFTPTSGGTRFSRFTSTVKWLLVRAFLLA